MNEYIEESKNLLEKEVDPRFYRKIDIQVQVPNTSKLRELTGWRPKIGIEQTLKDLFEYWMKKLN